MRIFEYKNKFYVDRDLVHQLKKEKFESVFINDMIVFFCPLCHKDYPIYEKDDFKVRLIAKTHEEGLYIVNGLYEFNQETFRKIWNFFGASEDEINHLICRLYIEEKNIMYKDLELRYIPPIIDYREVLDSVNAYLKDRRRLVDDFVDRMFVIPLKPIMPPPPIFEEPPWPQYPYDIWGPRTPNFTKYLYTAGATSDNIESSTVLSTNGVEEEKE